MTNPPPYLSIGEKQQYMVDRGYICDPSLTEASRAFLERFNFHYFLGYARNYRALAGAQTIPKAQKLDSIIDIVRLDQKLSVLLFEALRMFEWRLRAAVVDCHCRSFPSSSCFLAADHFSMDSDDHNGIQNAVIDQTLRSREPFLVSHFEHELARMGYPASRKLQELSNHDKLQVLDSVPIWAMVDNWSLGLLAKFVMFTKPETQSGNRLFKEVAGEFGISAQMIGTQLNSMVVLRNLIAHHSRLWMRPTTSTPKIPNRYKKRGWNCDSKSMYAAILALAPFLAGDNKDQQLLAAVDDILASNDIYLIGIKQPLEPDSHN